MPPKHRKVWTYLPEGSILFERYFKMGRARSYGKIIEGLRAEGYINNKTGKPPTHMAVWFRMWRWALHKENHSRAYEIFNKAMLDEGEYYDFPGFKKYLDEKAMTCFNYDPQSMRDYKAGVY